MESKARANTLDPETTERCLGVVKQLLAADCKPNARVPLWKEFGLTLYQWLEASNANH